MPRKHLVFLTGAGISVESGLSTFRGKDGLWTKEEFQYLASTDFLFEETQKSLDFYNMRRKRLAEVEPNEAHKLIAELENDYDVTIVTQNVDNLHERAGSTNIIHLHGELTKVCSTRNRYDEQYVKEYPLTTPIELGDDAGDDSQLRPYIVMFGESVPNMRKATAVVRSADIFVIVGTSLVVYPAVGLVDYVHPDIPRFIIDPSDMDMCELLGFTHFKTTATEGMKMLIEAFKEL